MDPRQPTQHPFSRNTASPYGRTPFPPSSNPTPFPATSHSPASTSYSEQQQQRRPSDPPYYNPPRNYAQDGTPMAGSGHSRHQSASSVGHSTRGMPPPSSPQQSSQQPAHHSYGPPPPRAPPVSVGPPISFPSSRELPSLPPLGRPASTAGSSMSISSMLGGPPSAGREQSSSQYASPVVTSAPQPSMYSGPSHASPRINTAGPDYAPFRRPQTPEHQRPYEPRDNRANSAGSPPGMGRFSTPEGRRLGTPHNYTQRSSQGQGMQPSDERREQPPVRVSNTAIPPRPNSQPNAFNPPPPRVSDSSRASIQSDSSGFGRRVENASRAPETTSRVEREYQRPASFEERHNPVYAYAERERQERDVAIHRERDQRDRGISIGEHTGSLHQEYSHPAAQRSSQSSYNRAPEPRDQPAWMRSGYEPRQGYEPSPPERPQTQQSQPSHAYEYTGTTAPQYGGHTVYASNDPRYPQTSQISSMPSQHDSNHASQYETPISERQRVTQQQHHSSFGGPAQNVSYQSQSSPGRRAIEESQQLQHQRNLLGVQEINRKGRVSPLPQAVQGAQGQLGGPGGEPGIKSDFGRVFSGIGSGVGSAMSVPSPVTAAPQGVPFSNSGQLRRDDLDSPVGQDSPMENGGHKIARTSSRGVRRRKFKEEDVRGDDESSTGRRTPSGRGRRTKTHHHHVHHHNHHHHHHRPDSLEHASSPSQSSLTPFKSVKGTAIPSPPGPDAKVAPILHHHHVPRHHHHHGTPAKPTPPANPVIPLRKTTVRSQAVLDAVAHLPRSHLGHAYYEAALKPGRPPSPGRSHLSRRGFASTSRPLPRFEGQENCTFTIKIPQVYLSPSSREEITSRRAVWGTDIYTDDSDIIAACIHQGWFRGEWPEDVDVSLLDLEREDVALNGANVKGKSVVDGILTEPPASGPMHVPSNRDLHVTVLVLPALEKYASITRFGIRSREWGGKHDGWTGTHDGLSFMISTIKWVEGVDSNEGRKGVARRKFLTRELDDAELEAEEAWGSLIVDGNRSRSRSKKVTEESFVRGGRNPDGVKVGRDGDIKNVGTGSWWKKRKISPKEETTETAMETEATVEKEGEQETAAEPNIVKKERISDEVSAAA